MIVEPLGIVEGIMMKLIVKRFNLFFLTVYLCMNIFEFYFSFEVNII